MATDPAFASTPHIASGLTPATADTSLTTPTNETTIFTAGSNGSKIEEITVVGVGTTVAGLVNIFLYDGSTYWLYDQFATTAVTVSTTAASYRVNRTYANLILKSGWSVRVTTEVVGNQALHCVTVIGGDF